MPSVTTTVRRALSLLDDERLARLSAGDRAGAFATLYARHHQALYRYCATIVREEADAQDALQATWLRALVALRRGQRDAPLRPWLFRIAHNESISILRRRARSREPVLVPAGPPASAEDGVLARERFTELVDDLRGLPDRARSALVLRELTGLSHEEIADALDITVAAARQSIYEGRRGLQDEARGRAMACPDIQLRISDGDRRIMRGRVVRAHLRQCPNCAAFAQSIDRRGAALGLFTPTLALAASGEILRRVLGAASGGGGAAGLGGAATGMGASAGGAATGGGVAGGGSMAGGVATKALGAGLLAKSLAATGAAVTAAGVTVALSANQPRTHHLHRGAPRAIATAATPSTSTTAAQAPVAHTEATRATLRPASAASGHGHVRASGQDRRGTVAHGRSAAAHRHAQPDHGRSVQAHAATETPVTSAVAHATHPARGRSAVAHAAHVARVAVHVHGRSSAAHSTHGQAHHGTATVHPTSAQGRGRTTGHGHHTATGHGPTVMLPTSAAPAHGNSSAAHSTK